MKISTNWLGEHAKTDLPPDRIADLLTMAGLEVESVELIGGQLDGVVVGEVLHAGPHPNADRLSLCSVDVGEDAPLSIVCGAPNVATGQRVAVATIGTTLSLPDRDRPGARVPLEIKRAKIRGEYSHGMICAEDELGLGDDHDGILVLAPDAPVGAPVATVLEAAGQPVGDAVLDVAITPNRPDATSHVGVARDLAALTGRALTLPDFSVPDGAGDVGDEISISIESPEGCPRFAAMIVKGVQIAESPAWLKARLRAVGLRPRNNVVDVTNFVMLELGQPLHAYDLATIAERRIIVRGATGGSTFVTLDGKERTLPAGALMVCDADREIGIAGVMGGMNTEVTQKTTEILIEGAYWDPGMIRKTSKALGLQTDASYRFERGVDSDGQAKAVSRAAALIAEMGEGTIVPGIADVVAREIPIRTTNLRLQQIDRHLGSGLPYDDVASLLSAIGFGVRRVDEDTVECTIPTFRPDVEREIDIIEELARLHGFDSFPMPETTSIPNFTPRERPIDSLLQKVHTVLVGSGFREICTNSLISESAAAQFNASVATTLEGDPVVTANAITSEMTTLRPSLMAGALPVLQYNSNRGQQRLRLFEVGTIFAKQASGAGLIPGYAEHTSLLIVASGPRALRAFDDDPRDTDYFDLKGVLMAIADQLRLSFSFSDITASNDMMAYGQAIRSGDTVLGAAGELAGALADAYDASHPVYFAEVNVSRLVDLAADKKARYEAVTRHPLVDRDIAVVVNDDLPAGDLLHTVRETAGELLLSADIFDVYRGTGISDGKKSIAIALRFGADRTLTDQEVDAAVERAISEIRKKLGGELRG